MYQISRAGFSAAVILLLLLLTLLAGCRAEPTFNSQAEPTVSAAPTSGPVTLSLWHSQTGARRTELESLARDFHSTYPDITITPVFVGNDTDLAKQVTAAIALGQTPDLVLATRAHIAQFARQSGLIALDELRDDASLGLSGDDLQDLLPGLLSEGAFAEFGNKFYAFPFDVEGVTLFYNPEILRTANFDHPPASWEEFLDMASRATRDEQYGWAMQIDYDVFAAMLTSRGGTLLDTSEQRARFAEANGVATMSVVAQLYKSGAAQLKPDPAAAIKDFAQRRAAFYIGWMSSLAELEAAQGSAGESFDFGIAQLPQADPKNPVMLIRGHDLAILKMPTERARSAWFFMRWLTAAQQSARWARATGAIPLRRSALPELAGDLSSSTRLRQIQVSVGTVIPRLTPRLAHPRSEAIERVLADAWSQALDAKTDITATLDAANSRVNALLAGTP